MIRLLYLNPSGILGGGEQSLLSLLATLNRYDYSPVVAAPADGPFGDQVMAMAIPFIPLAMPKRLEKLSLRGKRSTLHQVLTALPGVAESVSAIVKHVRQHQPALIHTNGIKAHVLGSVVGWLTDVRVVWHIRDFLGNGFWERWIIALGKVGTSQIIANSEAVRHSLAIRGLANKTVAISNGVNLHTFRPGIAAESVRRDLGISNDTLVIGMLGMLAPWKGQDVFLRAAAAVHAKDRTVRFLIVGSELYRTAGHGSFYQMLLQQVVASGLQQCVTFTGFRSDIAQVLNALDVVVHASVQPEPFGRVVVEAMACGCSVIATHAGGIPEVLGIDGKAGLLVPPGDSDAMAAAMLALIGDEPRRRTCGQAGRQRAEALFDVQLHTRRVESVYRHILGGQ